MAYLKVLSLVLLLTWDTIIIRATYIIIIIIIEKSMFVYFGME